MSNANQDSDGEGGNGFNFGPDILEALLRASTSTSATDSDDLNSLGAISGEYSSLNKTIDELNGFLDRWEERHSSLSSQIDEVLEEQVNARLQREKEKTSASSSSAGQQEKESEEHSDADAVISKGPDSSSVPLRGLVESSKSISQSQTAESPKTNSIDSVSPSATTTDVCNDSNSDDLVSNVEEESPCEKLS